MEPREYGFGERMAMSSGHASNCDIRSILLSSIPGALEVRQAAQANDRLGVDWWVEMTNARHLAVDAKVREEDWAAKHPEEDDIALETWSVIERQIVGWTRDESKRCDYVLWLWKETGRWCLVPFPMLCGVFREKWCEWKSAHKTRRQKTNFAGAEYHSECVFVPRRDVWAEIYKSYGGNIINL